MNSVLIAAICICVIGLIFCILMLIRNGIVAKIRLKALAVASKKAKESIKNGNDEWEKFYTEFESKGSYDFMLYSLTKWTYKDFYGDF